MKRRVLLVALLFCAAISSTLSLLAQTTIFTYQGQLNSSGIAASGSYDLRFTLYDSITNGTLIAGPLTNSATAVSNGLFTVKLDFGAAPFPGADRWLEIGVATNGAAFTTLAPRQQVTATPYAIRALNAGTATSAGAVNASNIVGTLSTTQLPAVVVTNGGTGLTLAGSFSGNGGGLTNLNAATLTNTIADARLSTNVALLNGTNVFTGTNRFTGVAQLNNANNTFSGTFSGNGAALTSLNATNMTSGTLADQRLSTNVAFLNATQTFSGPIQISGTVSGNGSGLTNLDLGQNSSGAIHPVSFTLSSSPSFPADIPIWVTAGDVNGDGKRDLIVASGNSLVYVLTNNGSGGFVLSSTNGVGANPTFVVAADINLDNNLDIITANTTGGGSISILTNNGSGRFSLSQTISSVNNPFSVAVADFNRDGKPDLAFDATTQITIFTNNGSGGFALWQNVSAPSGPFSIAAADVNGDTNMDLIYVDGSRLIVLTNNGIGGFVQSASISSVPAHYVTVADINGDGKPDIIAPYYAGNYLTVLTNSGNGLFAVASQPTVGASPYTVAAADVDGDGRLDLICANSGSASVTVLINQGAGIFASRATVAVGSDPVSIVAADLNGDGKPDAVTANEVSGNLSVLLNNGFQVTATFVGNGSSLSNLNASQLVSGTIADARLSTNVALLNGYNNLTGNFNGSGAGLTNIDLSQNSGGSIHPLSFTLASQPFLSGGCYSVVAGDVNNDNKPDLIAAAFNTSLIYVLTNDGHGGFVGSSTNGVNPQPLVVVAADFNNDNKLDFFSASANGNVTVWTNNGSGGFGSNSTFSVDSSPRSMVAVDINRDGKVDVVNASSSGNSLQIFTNNGSGRFVSFTNISGLFGSLGGIAAADVNGDTNVDLICANGGSGVFVLTNNGGGLFFFSTALAAPNPQNLIAVDVNGDGKPDIIAVNTLAASLTVFTNNGSGGFVLASTPATTAIAQTLTAVDIDGDGRPDLVTANVNGTDSILINIGGGNFSLRATLTVGSSPEAVVATDLNGDGRADVVTACAGANNLFVHLNNGVEFDGLFVGNGSSISNLNASQLTSGTIADARLSANVALLNANQAFTGSNRFAGVAILTNANNTLAGTFSGNGSGTFSGSFSGNGAGLTNIGSFGVVRLTAGTNKVASANFNSNRPPSLTYISDDGTTATLILRPNEWVQGASFTIRSSSATDTNRVGWSITP